jgi:predicted outer membrane protein
MAHANPIQIQKYLKGVDYPASREQLIENAKRLGADENICASLEQLPDEHFQTPADVSEAFKGPSSDDVGAGGATKTAAKTAPEAAPGTEQFLVQVMEDSLAEMELCMLALDNAGSEEVKAFAQTMIDEHGKLGQQIEKMAQQMRLAFPKKVRAEHASLIKRMGKLKGDQFDQKFIEENLRYHENDLKVFEHYAAQKDEVEVSKLAAAGARLFGRHLKMVKELAQKLKKR